MARAATLLKDDDDDAGPTDDTAVDLPNGLSGDSPRLTRTAEEAGQDYSIVETDDSFKPLTGPGSEQREEIRTDDTSTDTDQTTTERRERLSKAERRAVQRAARTRDQTELQTYREEVARLRTENDEFRKSVTPRLDQIDESRYRDSLAAVDRQIADAASTVDSAIQRISNAMATGDAEAHAQAMRDHTRAVTRGYELVSQKATLEASRSQRQEQPRQQEQRQDQYQPQQPRQQQQDPVVAERVREFTTNYSWLHLDKPDRNTRIALVIDEEVARDGFDPRDDDYWDELDSRLREALPGQFQRQQGQPRRQQAQTRNQTPPERRGPMVGGGGNGASEGPRKVLLSPERKQAMIQAGVLEADGRTIADRKRFNSLAARYDAYDRENGVAR